MACRSRFNQGHTLAVHHTRRAAVDDPVARLQALLDEEHAVRHHAGFNGLLFRLVAAHHVHVFLTVGVLLHKGRWQGDGAVQREVRMCTVATMLGKARVPAGKSTVRSIVRLAASMN